MISRIRIVSPFFTASPALASSLNTFPAAPASTLMLPAPADAAGAAAFGAAGAAALFGAEAVLGALPVSSTVTS